MNQIVLEADQTLLIIMGAGHAHTKVQYKAEIDRKLQLWEQLDDNPWIRLTKLTLQGPRSDPTQDGDFQLRGYIDTLELKPGQVYRMRAYWDDEVHDPNTEVPVDPPVEVVVQALRADAFDPKLLDAYGIEKGGTWITVQGAAIEPVSWNVQVGRGNPVPVGQPLPGVHPWPQTFNPPIDQAIHSSPVPIYTSPEFTGGLLAGNSYSCLTRVIARDGRWFERTDPVVLLQRTVTVTFAEVGVVNDGDNFSTGEGQFWLEVYQVPDDEFIPWNLLGEWTFGNDSYTISDGQVIALSQGGPSYSVTVGPFVLDAQNTQVAVMAHGTEYDGSGFFGAFDPDDKAQMIAPSVLWFPSGSQHEQDGLKFEIVATQTGFEPDKDNEGEFKFKARGDYAAVYSP